MCGTYIGGFPEPERAIRGTPETLRVCAESQISVARKTGSGEIARKTGLDKSTGGRLDG